MKMPPEPQWRTILGKDGSISYDAIWLNSHALNWHMSMNGEQVRLNYLAVEEMPVLRGKKDEVEAFEDRIEAIIDEFGDNPASCLSNLSEEIGLRRHYRQFPNAPRADEYE